MQPFGTIAWLDFVCHVDIGGLALAVAGVGLVGAVVLEIVVPHMDAGDTVSARGNRNNAGMKIRGRGPDQNRLENIEEQEVGKMIHSKLGSLETIGGPV